MDAREQDAKFETGISVEEIADIVDCHERHAQLWQDRHFCQTLGTIALITPLALRQHSSARGAKRERKAYINETEDFRRQLTQSGRDVVIAYGATAVDVAELAGDELISELYFIGNGSFSSVWTQTLSVSWRTLSEASDHLKEKIVQRTCGGSDDGIDLPIGTFNVQDQRMITTPRYGRSVPDKNPGDECFIQPFNKPVQSIEDLLNLEDKLSRSIHISTRQAQLAEAARQSFAVALQPILSNI